MNNSTSFLKVTIVGFGHVGRHLASALHAHPEVHLVEIFNRSPIDDKTPFSIIHDLSSINPDSDVYIICVSDDAIETVAKRLSLYLHKESIIAHTSGLQKTNIISAENKGIFYPLNTFSKHSNTDLSTTPFFINANNEETRNTLLALAKKLSTTVYELSDEAKEIAHLAAVISNNFSNVLIQEAETLLDESNLPRELIYPLLKTQNRLLEHHLAAQIQSGPAKRDDKKTMNRHLELLDNKKYLQEIYKTLSALIIENQSKRKDN